ncbi:PDZ/DHR/GLGF domain protein [Thermoanaerobacter mathranii subsp. mathranii str. A3]|uniref:PDZ/DHR/GLGF domain protein n=1 Tax=Thermoanaerobacter mathranii subsp. mathranii (strain DSM 11426 / CCUG 53645 / CIP 108742 / A3) TaxID=583358 RepID=A0ABM5LRL0_THEM3|nr:PDZ domain-containing protein [Thermoanaerobacter mathranii]ADH61455.1 PDZ/DHR/GLGF domain protein [Thermoanaerobacter mathranii subsp. mathranii str. A3]
MIAFIKVFWWAIETIALSVFNPFFWIVIILIVMQYRNKIAIEREIMGQEQEPMKELVLDSVFYGVIAAIIGSFLMIFLGITIENIGLQYVWPLAIVLMLVNPRYICFSYAGGIVSLFSLFFGFPNINVPALMSIVGVLHLMESLLIYIDGPRNTTPIFVRLKDGRVAGGFTMQKFWPIPFAALTIVTGTTITGQVISMPDWWPIIKPSGINLNNVIFLMMPAIAALGYGDLALSQFPEKKTRISSLRLFGFSVVLIALAVLGIYIKSFQYLAAVFAPAVHELLILIGQKEEKENPPLFVAPDKGVMILATAKGSPAREIGIKPGDVILKINDVTIEEPDDIIRVLNERPSVMWITVKDLNGNYINYEYKDPQGILGLGILIVPKATSMIYEINEEGIFIKKLKEIIKNIFKRNK